MDCKDTFAGNELRETNIFKLLVESAQALASLGGATTSQPRRRRRAQRGPARATKEWRCPARILRRLLDESPASYPLGE